MNAILQAHRERVGRRIKTARNHAGLSHDKLGALVGTSRQHLIKLEKGRHLPSEALLGRIADATGKTVAYFESESEDEEEEEADVAAILLATIRRLVREEMKAAA